MYTDTGLGKVHQLVLYIARKSRDDPKFARTKLQKLLFWSDVKAYRKTGKPISNCRYVKWKHGPVAKALPKIIEEIESAGVGREESGVESDGFKRHVLVALKDIGTRDLAAQELALVDEAIDDLSDMSATKASKWSHQFPAWDLTPDNEEIPLSRTLVRKPRKSTQQECAIGREIFSIAEAEIRRHRAAGTTASRSFARVRSARLREH